MRRLTGIAIPCHTRRWRLCASTNWQTCRLTREPSTGNEMKKGPVRGPFPDSRRRHYLKRMAACCSVIHTPQRIGMPTADQASAALASSPPWPMPNEPDGPAALFFVLA